MAAEDSDITIVLNQIPDWDDSIEWGLHERILKETGTENSFKNFSVYAVWTALACLPLLAGGCILEFQGDTLWIDAIWVAPMFRRKGLGTRIINKTTDLAINHDSRSIQLNTYFKDNLPFFKRNGFQEVACIPHWKYGLDCYFMRKTI